MQKNYVADINNKKIGEEQNHFSLRKLSVGLASVLVGVSIFGTSQTVKADTVADGRASTVTNNAQSSDTQENENAVVKSSFSSDNQANNAKSNLTQTQVNDQNTQKQDQITSLNQNSTNSQEANDRNDLNAEKNIVSTSSLQKSDNQSNKTPEAALQTTQNVQSFNLKQNSLKLAKKVLATNLIETNSSLVTNGGFDEATWGKLDVTRWQGSVQDGVYQLTNYTGDGSDHVIVPNEADFEKAGKSTNGLQVGITRDTAYFLSEVYQTIAFSKTNNKKVKAIGTDWSEGFAGEDLSKFDGSNLDISSVTNMRSMFSHTSISDLTSLTNWNVSNVTNMKRMFYGTSISDLTPLKNWDTSKVTDMSLMFASNSISDLTPLANWNVSKVTDMSGMFNSNSIRDLTPLAHWNTSNVTDMNSMFEDNQISDLTPLAHWDVHKVTNMSVMFNRNSISDLTPLANWNVSNGTSMGRTFAYNPDIIDLKPISNWNVDAASLFLGNTKLNLTNINNTPLMQSSLKTRDALYGATFITNNADLVKVTIGQDLPTFTNKATRTIVFNIPHATPETTVQHIYYETIAPVQVDSYGRRIVKTYPVKDVKESDWPLDDSKQNDDVIIDGAICFKPVKIPHVNGYKAHLVRNKLNPASFMVSFFAIPTETKPSKPIEETPSKPSAPADNTNKSVDDLQKRIATKLNSHYSDWTMPADVSKSTYTVEVPANDAIDLSDLMIAQPVHAQTRTQVRVTKHVKLRKHGKKHVIKHFKHRKKTARTFKKYRL